VSPGNVLVGTDGVAKIADFGIAKSFDSHGERTDTDSLKGKVGYMAPEYIEHQSSSPAVDLFALAVVAWESLTSTRLFRSATEIETLRRVVAGRVPELGSIAPELTPLDPVLRRALAVRPDERQPTVQAFAAELESVARAADLVASHPEVAALVTSALGEALAERRRLLSRPEASPVSRPPPRGRDDVATASFGGSASRLDEPTKPDTPAAHPSRRGRRLAIGGSITAVAAVAGLALAAARSASPSAPPPSTTPFAAPPASSAAPPTTPSRISEPPAPPDAQPPASTTPPASSSSRKTAPSRVLVPRKAPPNPYLR
jgi:serine/threonine-protein kinase